MKKKLIYIFVFCTILAYGSFVFLPDILSNYHVSSTYKHLNLKTKKIKYGNDFFEYTEGGSGKTLVFIHGFQSNKDYWIPYLKKLSKDYFVIALDLAGHGKSSRPKDQIYDLQSMTGNFTKFIDAKKLNNFSLIGVSMGGGIATVYAYNNPSKVSSLVLINPLGIDHENKSELQQMVTQGKNIFFPNDVKEFNEMVFYISGKYLDLSDFFKKYLVSKMKKNYTFFKQAFDDLLTKTQTIDDLLPKINIPTLLLLSQKDRIIHPSSYEYFVKLMPNSKSIRFQNAGHTLVDNDRKVAIEEIDKFLKDY